METSSSPDAAEYPPPPDIDLSAYAPKPAPLIFDQRIIGTGAMRVYQGAGRVHFVADDHQRAIRRERVPQTPPPGDTFADLDFRVSWHDTNTLKVNSGEVSWLKWDGFDWIQEYLAIPETLISNVTARHHDRWVFLVVPLEYHETLNGTRPIPAVRSSVNSGGFSYDYIRFNRWQGPSTLQPPTYEILTYESRTPAEPDIFAPALCKITPGNLLELVHVGQIQLPQGYHLGVQIA